MPIVVAINKCDLPDADPQKIKNQLLEHELIAEDLSGDTLMVEISAKPTGKADIALAIENIVTHINRIHNIEGVNFVKPSEILAKLLEAMPKIIPLAKNKYPKRGFILNNKEF